MRTVSAPSFGVAWNYWCGVANGSGVARDACRWD